MDDEQAFPVIRQTVLDTTDPRRLAEFYRQLFSLRYVPGYEPPGPGQPDRHGQDWLILTSPAGGPALAFQKVGELPGATWPDGPVPQQLHRSPHNHHTDTRWSAQRPGSLRLPWRCRGRERVPLVTVPVTLGRPPPSPIRGMTGPHPPAGLR